MEVDLLLKTIFLPDDNNEADLDERTENFAAFTKTIERLQLERELEKYGDTLAGDDWNEVIVGAPRVQLSKVFLERSQARLERVSAEIRAIFGEHEELAEEAIGIAKTVLAVERQAMIAT